MLGGRRRRRRRREDAVAPSQCCIASSLWPSSYARLATLQQRVGRLISVLMKSWLQTISQVTNLCNRTQELE